jgi:hypothetical protein
VYLNDRISFISPCKTLKQYLKVRNHIDRVIVVVLVSSAVDRGFESLSSQTKDYEIGICLFSVKHTALRSISKDMCCFSSKQAAIRSKSKAWLACNHNNMSE